MATIEIEADDSELLDIRLVGVDYLINPPKSSLTINMAESFASSKESVKLSPNATPEEKKAAAAAKLEASKKLGKKAMKALNTWITQAFGEDGAKGIHKRLNDPKDKLDIKHLMALMTQVSEAVTGDPTT